MLRITIRFPEDSPYSDHDRFIIRALASNVGATYGSFAILSKPFEKRTTKLTDKENAQILALVQAWVDEMFPNQGLRVERPGAPAPPGPAGGWLN